VWTLYHLLKTGKEQKLMAQDKVLLENCLARHPRLAQAILDGKTIGIISAHSDGWIASSSSVILRINGTRSYQSMTIDVQTPKDLLPYQIIVQGRNWQKRLNVTQQGLLVIELPGGQKTPEVIQVGMHGRDFVPDPSVLGMRIGFLERS
jgi:hypothetical protein